MPTSENGKLAEQQAKADRRAAEELLVQAKKLEVSARKQAEELRDRLSKDKKGEGES